MSFVPKALMDKIAKAWDPPLNPAYHLNGMWLTRCDSRPPKVGLTFGGKKIVIDPQDLLLQQGPKNNPEKGTWCTVGVSESKGLVGGDMHMMGGTFMKSMVAVFDIGAAEIRFAERLRDAKKEGKKGVSFAA